jgi:hypothetical protein
MRARETDRAHADGAPMRIPVTTPVRPSGEVMSRTNHPWMSHRRDGGCGGRLALAQILRRQADAGAASDTEEEREARGEKVAPEQHQFLRTRMT